jgi:hypothetical protein
LQPTDGTSVLSRDKAKLTNQPQEEQFDESKKSINNLRNGRCPDIERRQ